MNSEKFRDRSGTLVKIKTYIGRGPVGANVRGSEPTAHQQVTRYQTKCYSQGQSISVQFQCQFPVRKWHLGEMPIRPASWTESSLHLMMLQQRGGGKLSLVKTREETITVMPSFRPSSQPHNSHTVKVWNIHGSRVLRERTLSVNIWNAKPRTETRNKAQIVSNGGCATWWRTASSVQIKSWPANHRKDYGAVPLSTDMDLQVGQYSTIGCEDQKTQKNE